MEADPVVSLPVQLLTLEGRSCRLDPAVPDAVAVEAPLEIRVDGRSIAVIMRSPGRDRELAAGFLLSEGVIASPQDLFEVSVCPAAAPGGGVVDVLVTKPEEIDFDRLTRHVFTASSCGVCGKTSMDSALAVHPPLAPPTEPWCDAAVLFQLPELQRAAQTSFDRTGGQHAAALFSRTGELRALEEDVGRHNAVDKITGAALLSGNWPLDDAILLLSGRASFELIQKALAARIPMVCSIGAPSSLAVSLAASAGITLCGFLRSHRANVYTHPERLGLTAIAVAD
jgi:FdhD protein